MQRFLISLGTSLKSVVKLLLKSRAASSLVHLAQGNAVVVMGNGPSLSDTIAKHGAQLEQMPLMSVNFAGLTEEFLRLKPIYYVLADPVFFRDLDNANVNRLWQTLGHDVTWPMTLFVPVGTKVPPVAESINVARYNMLGIEGFEWLEHLAWRRGWGMPRPRNVLIPSLMQALRMGYSTVYVAGADHSWTRTLSVSDDNVVVSVQPHFYTDNEAEHQRVTQVYADVHMPEIMYSFHLAFKAYWAIRRFAGKIGSRVVNITPGSFIDAFERGTLS